jgi:energy-converting hydrogenase Eha subunit C
MNKDQVFGIVRTVVAAVAGFLAGKGYLDASMVEALSGAIATIAVAVWSVTSKK